MENNFMGKIAEISKELENFKEKEEELYYKIDKKEQSMLARIQDSYNEKMMKLETKEKMIDDITRKYTKEAIDSIEERFSKITKMQDNVTKKNEKILTLAKLVEDQVNKSVEFKKKEFNNYIDKLAEEKTLEALKKIEQRKVSVYKDIDEEKTYVQKKSDEIKKEAEVQVKIVKSEIDSELSHAYGKYIGGLQEQNEKLIQKMREVENTRSVELKNGMKQLGRELVEAKIEISRHTEAEKRKM